MGIKNHLQCLTGIGNAKRFATVAQAELGDLYFHRNAAQFNLFITPVELKGVTGIISQRNEGFDGSRIVFSL